MKRIDWTVEEMVAMVDLYYRYKADEITDLEEKLAELSRKLVHRAEMLHIDHDEKYRNINGMRMIFENVRYIDTNGLEGLSGSSRMVNEIVKIYHENRIVFDMILKDFNKNY